MENILKNKFEIKKNEETEYILWQSQREKITMCSINFIINNFSEFDKNVMLSETPTEGWENTIERWNELGKFE